MSKQSSVTIKLDEPLQTHSGFVNEIILRAPTVDDYFEIGDLVSNAILPGGVFVPQDNTVAIKQYIDRLVQKPVTSLDLGNGSLRLAAQLSQAVQGFFTAARQVGEPSPTSPSNSGTQVSSASNT